MSWFTTTLPGYLGFGAAQAVSVAVAAPLATPPPVTATSQATTTRAMVAQALGPIVKPAQVLHSWLARKSVIKRDAGGRIVAPAHQYVLAPLNGDGNDNGKKGGAKKAMRPAGFPLLVKAGLLGATLWFCNKSDVITSSTNLGSLIDSTAEWVTGQDDLLYLKGFFLPTCEVGNTTDVPLQNCYYPGAAYYQRALQNPASAHLFEGAPVLSGLPRHKVDAFLWWSFLLGIAMPYFMREFGRLMEHVPGNYSDRISWPAAVVNQAALALSLGLIYAMSDSAGKFQYQPGGSSSIWGNWDKWDWGLNAEMVFALWAAKMLLAAPDARCNPLVMHGSAVTYTAIGDLIRGKSSSLAAKLYAAGFVGVGTLATYALAGESVWCLFEGGYRPVWHTAWLAAAGALSYVIGNAVLGDGRMAQTMFQEVSPDIVDGVELPAYCFVRGKVLQNQPDEKRDIDDGSYFEAPQRKTLARTVATVMLGGAVALGLDSVVNLAQGQSDTFVLDLLWSAVGAAAAAVTVDALIRPGRSRQNIKKGIGSLMTLFIPRKIGYWMEFALFAGTVNLVFALAEESLQGNRMGIGNYGRTNAEQSYFGAGWINRVNYAVQAATNVHVLSNYGYLMPGWLGYRYPLMAQKRTAQTVTNAMTALVADFAVADLEVRGELALQIHDWVQLLKTNVENKGYGHDETYERARLELANLDWLVAQLAPNYVTALPSPSGG